MAVNNILFLQKQFCLILILGNTESLISSKSHAKNEDLAVNSFWLCICRDLKLKRGKIKMGQRRGVATMCPWPIHF